MENKVARIFVEKIIKMMENGTAPWRKTWKATAGETPTNLSSMKPYRGFNSIWLNFVALESGFESNYWVTYKQARDLGGFVKKGSESTGVIFYKKYEYYILDGKKISPGEMKKLDDDDRERVVTKQKFTMRYYNVFNLDQTEGIEEPEKPEVNNPDFKPEDSIEDLLEEVPNLVINQRGDKAFFSQDLDIIQVPKPECFESESAYYSTLFHELTHWTGAASRLNRKSLVDYDGFGNYNYSQEELVAEFGACFLCSHFGIDNTGTIENSAAYLQSWKKKLEDDPAVLFVAAAHAQKAFDFILGYNND